MQAARRQGGRCAGRSAPQGLGFAATGHFLLPFYQRLCLSLIFSFLSLWVDFLCQEISKQPKAAMFMQPGQSEVTPSSRSEHSWVLAEAVRQHPVLALEVRMSRCLKTGSEASFSRLVRIHLT